MLEHAYRLLQSYNLRVTPQRKAILAILLDSKGEHPDSEEIYHRLIAKKTGRKIGRATVNRSRQSHENLRLLQGLPKR